MRITSCMVPFPMSVHLFEFACGQCRWCVDTQSTMFGNCIQFFFSRHFVHAESIYGCVGRCERDDITFAVDVSVEKIFASSQTPTGKPNSVSLVCCIYLVRQIGKLIWNLLEVNYMDVTYTSGLSIQRRANRQVER